MKILFKMIFEDFFSEGTLIDDMYVNMVLVTIITSIAFVLAYRFVGRLYDDSMISGRTIGSFIHWMVRALILGTEIMLIRFSVQTYEFVIGLFS